MNPILRKGLLDLEQILDKAKENGIDFLNALDQVVKKDLEILLKIPLHLQKASVIL